MRFGNTTFRLKMPKWPPYALNRLAQYVKKNATVHPSLFFSIVASQRKDAGPILYLLNTVSLLRVCSDVLLLPQVDFLGRKSAAWNLANFVSTRLFVLCFSWRRRSRASSTRSASCSSSTTSTTCGTSWAPSACSLRSCVCSRSTTTCPTLTATKYPSFNPLF